VSQLNIHIACTWHVAQPSNWRCIIDNYRMQREVSVTVKWQTTAFLYIKALTVYRCRQKCAAILISRFRLELLIQPTFRHLRKHSICESSQSTNKWRTLLHGRQVDASCSVNRCQHFCVKWRHSHRIKSVRSNRKYDSVNRYAFAWRTFLPNFIPIRFGTTEP